ncbi:MAG: adenylyl-sulfate kinase [Aeromicrobium sp.]
MGGATAEEQVESAATSRLQFTPTARELDDVELLRMGLFGSPSRFEGAEGPMRLCVPPEVADAAVRTGGLEITDAEGVPLAVVSIEGTAPTCVGHVGVIGTVRPLRGNSRRAFRKLYVSPSASRTVLPPDTVTVPVDAPLTADDLATLKAMDRPVLFLVLAGFATPQGMSAPGLIRATLVAATEFDDATVYAVPLASRPTVRRDEEFRVQVVEAYAPGPDIWWPTGAGEVTGAVADVVEHDRPTGLDRGVVVFFTGLSGSGKSTLAQTLCNRLIESGGRTVTLLDGDRVRRNVSQGLSFSREDRERNIERIAWIAAEVARHGGLAVCCPIAPFEQTRHRARAMAAEVGADFALIHVSTPIEVCEARDRKGLYARARRGEVRDFTGISSPYEVPNDADLVIDTTDVSISEAVAVVWSFLVTRGFLPENA